MIVRVRDHTKNSCFMFFLLIDCGRKMMMHHCDIFSASFYDTLGVTVVVAFPEYIDKRHQIQRNEMTSVYMYILWKKCVHIQKIRYKCRDGYKVMKCCSFDDNDELSQRHSGIKGNKLVYRI